MDAMSTRTSVAELARRAGISPPVSRQPCLSAPSKPPPRVTDEDRTQARNLLSEQRMRKPGYVQPDKQLKRIFRSSRVNERLGDPTHWVFSQEELDEALLGVINEHQRPSLVQALLDLGASVNIVEASKDKTKKKNDTLTRRSTVLQRAISKRGVESVSLLASSGADRRTLNDGLKVALAEKDLSCIEELLRHGADINQHNDGFTQAVASADLALLHLLLRAPQPPNPDLVSRSLHLAAQFQSIPTVCLLIAYGADPNHHDASAFKQALSTRNYHLAVAIASSPIAITPHALQGTFDIVLRNPDQAVLEDFIELLLACGLPSTTEGISQLLVCAAKSNRITFARKLVKNGVSPDYNGAESLKRAISDCNWLIVDILLSSTISRTNASDAVVSISTRIGRQERLSIIDKLAQRGATGIPLGEFLIVAVEEDDLELLSLLVRLGAPLNNRSNRALLSVIAMRDLRKLRLLLRLEAPPAALSQLFPLLRQGYTRSERLDASRLLLEAGAKGHEVDQALIDAVADTTPSRDFALIEILRSKADVDCEEGMSLVLAIQQKDLPVIRSLCNAGPSVFTVSKVLPLAFGVNGLTELTASEVLRIVDLLLPLKPSSESVAQAVTIAVSGGFKNIDIITRLVGNDAAMGSFAFRAALRLTRLEDKLRILSALLPGFIPPEETGRALVMETETAVHSNILTLVQLLLHNGAPVDFNEGEALRIAAVSTSVELLDILLGTGKRSQTSSVTKAFRALMHDNNSQKNRDSIKVAELLLKNGVDQPAIDSALRSTLDELSWGSSSGQMVDLLLDHHANVNTADGTCFTFAARTKALDLFAKLLAHNPDYRVIIPSLLGSGLDEPSLVAALKICFDNGCPPALLDLCGRGRDPPLVVAMRDYPRSKSLVSLLLALGCTPDIAAKHVLDHDIGEEAVSALLWALDQPQKKISTSVIQALLEAGASPLRRSPRSDISPLTLAAREARPEIVADLLARGAEPSFRDNSNRSVLFYASSKPVTSIVKSLCEAKALRDDGSLHEAACSLQLSNASLLLEHDHKPNFPSRLHGGRSALGQLCLGVEVTNSDQRTKLRQMIRLLLDAGANAKFRARDKKSVVILALDNPHHAVEVTDALLETEVWEDLNDDKHLYHDDAGYCYSPLKYAELMPRPGRDPQKRELMEVLIDKACVPKFYAEEGEQPAGAVGLPAHLARIAARRTEQRTAMQLEREADEHSRRLAETKHLDDLRRAKERELAAQAALQNTHAVQARLEAAKHDSELRRIREAERVKRDQRQEAANQQLQIEEREGIATYQREQRFIEQRRKELDYRNSAEQRALLEKEKVFERNVQRQKALIDRNDQSAKLHAKLQQEKPNQLYLEQPD
ncbi:ankyrin [Mytilinidion resinicola]|uniref:Ankyrin n=1 Tax=Mytilinidion resinicola TaxID=574789 RepID=A0A6A6Y3Y7_9PEZI|nr:ankyrin [Mytilinidion resinicola]KAF2803492.1 ankyrin [Mytilinidion resinicola]